MLVFFKVDFLISLFSLDSDFTGEGTQFKATSDGLTQTKGQFIII